MTLLNQFKSDLLKETGIKIDFRTHKYLHNNYGLSPVFDYDDAKIIVKHLYAWANNYVREHKDNYRAFAGWHYNLEMELDKLRTGDLKTLVLGVIEKLENE